MIQNNVMMIVKALKESKSFFKNTVSKLLVSLSPYGYQYCVY